MSTKIAADNGVELEVCHLGIDATNPNPAEPSSIWARLTAEQRAKLAAALAPERTPIVEGRPVHGITVTGYVGDAPINPADCDRTTVYTGECRNFADTEWIRFESGRRRSPDARDGNTWLIDVVYGSFWMADDKVRNLVPLVPATAPAVSRADIEKAILSRRWNTSGPDSQGFAIIHIPSAVDAVREAVDIQAEQSVDPVEARVTTRHPEHYRLVNEADGSEWRMNRAGKWLPADLLGQEADQ